MVMLIIGARRLILVALSPREQAVYALLLALLIIIIAFWSANYRSRTDMFITLVSLPCYLLLSNMLYWSNPHGPDENSALYIINFVAAFPLIAAFLTSSFMLGINVLVYMVRNFVLVHKSERVHRETNLV
jgi:hypothetical protein